MFLHRNKVPKELWLHFRLTDTTPPYRAHRVSRVTMGELEGAVGEHGSARSQTLVENLHRLHYTSGSGQSRITLAPRLPRSRDAQQMQQDENL